VTVLSEVRNMHMHMYDALTSEWHELARCLLSSAELQGWPPHSASPMRAVAVVHPQPWAGS